MLRFGAAGCGPAPDVGATGAAVAGGPDVGAGAPEIGAGGPDVGADVGAGGPDVGAEAGSDPAGTDGSTSGCGSLTWRG